jgi:hypothetical protein
MSRLYRNNNDQYEQTERLINNRLAYVNTNLLVEVKAINGKKITVQPTGLRFYTDNNLQQQQKPYGQFDVNIIQLKGITVPISVSQIGLLIVNQYDIANITDNEDLINRRFDLLDGVFIPTILQTDTPSSDTLKLSGENLITSFTSTKIENSNSDSLIKVVIDALTVLKNLVTQDNQDTLSTATQSALQSEIDKLQAFNP